MMPIQPRFTPYPAPTPSNRSPQRRPSAPRGTSPTEACQSYITGRGGIEMLLRVELGSKFKEPE